MIVLIVQLSGVAVFVCVTVVLGVLLRRNPERQYAENLSRVSHVAFWLGLIPPWAIGFIVPGPAGLDRAAGMTPLPLPVWARLALGGPMLVAGSMLMHLSMARLGRGGRGAPAFKLTQEVVASGVYGLVRNPMALGYYVALVGGSVLGGSTYVLLYTVLGVIPAHLFNLKFFEELELSLRYGESYETYRRSTPLLLPHLGVHRRAG